MRKFLVVLDDSRECLNAMRFAAMRAAHTQAGVEILAVIPPEEFNHWIGVGDIMRQEARERIEAHGCTTEALARDSQQRGEACTEEASAHPAPRAAPPAFHPR